MAEKLFDSFKNACEFAKHLAKNGVQHKLRPYGTSFLVAYDDSGQESQITPNWEAELKQTINDANTFVESQEDCKQYIGEILFLLEHVQNDLDLVAGALRTIKELEIKLPQLSASSDIEEQREIKRKEQTLLKNAPLCPRCHVSMTLRESIHGYFWGCKNFALPAFEKCFRKKTLTREESLILDSPF